MLHFSLHFAGKFTLLLLALAPRASAQTFAFTTPGGPFLLTVPATGCASAVVSLRGGGGSGQFGFGGAGAVVNFSFTPLPSEALSVWVGGGGSGLASLALNQKTYGGAGGGGSALVSSARILGVAGGGGGAVAATATCTGAGAAMVCPPANGTDGGRPTSPLRGGS